MYFRSIEPNTDFVSGMDVEGIYRIPGSRVHADNLLAKYLSSPSSIDLEEMDIAICSVTSALKTYLSEHIPPVIPKSFLDELTDSNCNYLI